MLIPPFARLVIKMVIQGGVNEVLMNVVKSTTPADITPTRMTMVKIGTYAITQVVAGWVAEKTIKQVENFIEEALGSSPTTNKFNHTEQETPIGRATDIVSTEDGIEFTIKKGVTAEEASEIMRSVAENMNRESSNGGA